jgi:hypothetical protein
MYVKSMQSASHYLRMMQPCKNMNAAIDQSRVASIRSILMQGKKLRTDEMDYLQRHDPNLYDQAMRISMERRAYEDTLQFSRSKAEANRYSTYMLMQIAGQVKHGRSEELLMRTNAIQDAHREFVRSSKYTLLR